MASRRQSPPYVRIADAVAEHLRTSRSERLPGARTLARMFGCSFATMLKALRVLQERGLLIIDGNRRARLASSQRPAPAASRERAADRLHGIVRNAIVTGTYRVGDQLPKAGYFALEHRCSRTTVACALQRLCEERLCHRRGKAWVVGPHETHARDTRPADRPAILVLLPNEDHWRMISRDSKEYKHFVAQFAHEAEKHGIRLVMAFTSPQENRTLSSLWPQGQKQIAGRVRHLGSHYLGALVPCNHLEIPELEQWLRLLLELGRPVVWLDRTEEGLYSPLKHRLFFRCTADSREGSRVILRAFHDAGHRTIGLTRLFWHQYLDPFIDDMTAMTSEFDPRMRLVVEREPHPTMDTRPDGEPVGAVLQRLSRSGIPALRRLCARLLKRHPDLVDGTGAHAPVGWRDFWRGAQYVSLQEFQVFGLMSRLVPLLRNPDITALICPGNKNTRFYFWWFEAMGISVPRDLSVISVDNSYDFHPWPISSIDLGYGYLGYAAIHLFMGDIPVHIDRHHTVTGPVSFHDRGSLGPPRSGALRVQLNGGLL
jgi:DNA-binding transcriptional regulator YhcF (GntR family)